MIFVFCLQILTSKQHVQFRIIKALKQALTPTQKVLHSRSFPILSTHLTAFKTRDSANTVYIVLKKQKKVRLAVQCHGAEAGGGASLPCVTVHVYCTFVTKAAQKIWPVAQTAPCFVSLLTVSLCKLRYQFPTRVNILHTDNLPMFAASLSKLCSSLQKRLTVYWLSPPPLLFS